MNFGKLFLIMLIGLNLFWAAEGFAFVTAIVGENPVVISGDGHFVYRRQCRKDEAQPTPTCTVGIDLDGKPLDDVLAYNRLDYPALIPKGGGSNVPARYFSVNGKTLLNTDIAIYEAFIRRADISQDELNKVRAKLAALQTYSSSLVRLSNILQEIESPDAHPYVFDDSAFEAALAPFVTPDKKLVMLRLIESGAFYRFGALVTNPRSRSNDANLCTDKYTNAFSTMTRAHIVWFEQKRHVYHRFVDFFGIPSESYFYTGPARYPYNFIREDYSGDFFQKSEVDNYYIMCVSGSGGT